MAVVFERGQTFRDPNDSTSTKGVATGVYRYIYPKNQSTLKKTLCGCSSPVTQDRFDMIYVHVWDINKRFEIAKTS